MQSQTLSGLKLSLSLCLILTLIPNVHYLYLQLMELTLPPSSRRVSLDQRLTETEGYYKLLREQVQVGGREERRREIGEEEGERRE